MQLKGKVILITGSTDGVGRRVAERLGAEGAHILVHGRDAARGAAVVRAIQAAGGTAKFYAADFSSLAEVRRLADAVREDNAHIHILINNAGVGTGPQPNRRQVSADGHELRFAVNYLAGYLLTTLLLPTLRASAPARIVNVTSAGQQAIDFNDVMLTHSYSGARAYTQSKLAQIMFTIDLADMLAGTDVTATCVHPASYMDTTMVRLSGVPPMSTVEQGAEAIVRLAASDAVQGVSGEYFHRLQTARANVQAYDKTARARLRDLSERLVGFAEPKARAAGR